MGLFHLHANFCLWLSLEEKKTTFPRLLCSQSLGLDSSFHKKRIPLKDVELGPELRGGGAGSDNHLLEWMVAVSRLWGSWKWKQCSWSQDTTPLAVGSCSWKLSKGSPPPALSVILQATGELIANSCLMKSTKVALVCVSKSSGSQMSSPRWYPITAFLGFRS